MIKLMVGNQKGGVAKTTTAISLARCFADFGLRTLLVDADPQGSILTLLRLRPEKLLSHFILENLRLPDCVVQPASNLDVLCGNRDTTTMEQRIFAMYGREHTFANAFRVYETNYDVILVDVAPSISLLQACSMVFCQKVLIPADMDTLAVSGAGATIFSEKTIASSVRVDIETLALLPTNVNRTRGLTDVVMNMLQELGSNYSVPVLSQIRTDATVGKAARAHQMLEDFDPKCKAAQDYRQVATDILRLYGREVEELVHDEILAS